MNSQTRETMVKGALQKIVNWNTANRNGEAILAGLGLINDNRLCTSTSMYARSVKKMLEDKGGQVVNRDELLYQFSRLRVHPPSHQCRQSPRDIDTTFISILFIQSRPIPQGCQYGCHQGDFHFSCRCRPFCTNGPRSRRVCKTIDRRQRLCRPCSQDGTRDSRRIQFLRQ